MMTIYQAGPLFSEAERLWHDMAKKKLHAAGFTVIWPGDLFTQQQIEGWGGQAPKRIMEGCREAIHRATVVMALLDGAQVDDGTAWELGYAFAKGLPVYGVRTDFRQAGDTKGSKVNAMIEGSCNAITRSVDELIAVLRKDYPL